MRGIGLCVALGATLVLSGCAQTDDPPPSTEGAMERAVDAESVPEFLEMGGARSVTSFFITSAGLGRGGDLGGLAGADAHCQALAAAEYAGDHTWRAYLSTTGPDGVDARDRIGDGPWYNARGVKIADDVVHLHGEENNLTKETQVSEFGLMINGRGDSPNRHDILTGTQMDGTAVAGTDDTTCSNWAITTARVVARTPRPGTTRTPQGAAVSRTSRARAGMACSTASPSTDAVGFPPGRVRAGAASFSEPNAS